jgi:molybdopterin converting factor small subunit
VINLAEVLIKSPDLKSLIRSKNNVNIERERLSDILVKLTYLYPQIKDKVFIDQEKKIINGKLQIYHNKKLVTVDNLDDYDEKICSSDEIILMSIFSGG